MTQQGKPAYLNPTPASRTYWVSQDKKLLAGAYPGKPEHFRHVVRLEALYDAGMRTFINLQEEDETNQAGEPFVRYDEYLRRLAVISHDAVHLLRFPIPDRGVPSVDRMSSILDAIDLSLTARRGVYVHCFGGMGRTGTVICCWLLRHGYVDHSTVFSTLNHLRQADAERCTWKAPENELQESFVLNWKG